MLAVERKAEMVSNRNEFFNKEGMKTGKIVSYFPAFIIHTSGVELFFIWIILRHADL